MRKLGYCWRGRCLLCSIAFNVAMPHVFATSDTQNDVCAGIGWQILG